MPLEHEIQCFCPIKFHSPAQLSELYFQMANSPLSLQVASSPASFGFQDTQLTSWLWALGTWAVRKKMGCSGSAVGSSLNTRTPSSPQAVAKAPVRRHLNMRMIIKIQASLLNSQWMTNVISKATFQCFAASALFNGDRVSASCMKVKFNTFKM